ncbi:glutathione S-transferase family protein [Algirhabdus cladophorae]|uniref:glutathione S-transferase family protein n=1 Tax=Algirhabdus cladophorae TaxID=3377108 RepID=UPI003B84B4BD
MFRFARNSLLTLENGLPDLELFVAPGSCARVPTIALEEIGVKFDTTLVRTAIGQQKSAEFLAVNPKGKVPVLVVNGVPLTENVAILSWLNKSYPDAGLLPSVTNDFDAAQQISDLAFFSGTVHPHVTRVAMPMKFIEDAKLSFDIVRSKGTSDMNVVMGMINDRLADRPWWYGDDWSIVDGYLFWTWWRICVVGYPQDAFPHLKDHALRIAQRPSVMRALQREARNIEILKSEGIYKEPV